MKVRNRKGFTLAEVLITLIVIGVISALTIPNILQNTQNAEFKAAFKRIYSDLEQASKRIMQDNAGTLAGVFVDPIGNLTMSDDARDKYMQHMSYVKTCNDSDVDYSVDGDGHFYIMSNCWSKYNYYLNKNVGQAVNAIASQAILSNGASLDFYISRTNCSNDISYNEDGSLQACGAIMVDVNGMKLPNQYGKDIFYMFVTKDGLRAQGTQADYAYGECDPNVTGSNGTGYACAALVLQNKDY